MNSPAVSVVVPTYNRAELIVEAIGSVRVQTFADWEAVVVDDGSTDDTTRVVEDISRQDPRVRVIRIAKSGAQAARNAGIREARGEWISFLDSDDRYLPNSIEVRLNAASFLDVQVVHSECQVQDEESSRLYGVPALQGKILRSVLARPGPVFPSFLVHSSALAAIGRLDEELVSWQEWDTAIRLARHFRFGFVAEPTFVYNRMVSDSISTDLERDARGYLRVVRKHWPSMVVSGGPRVLSEHFRFASSRYRDAGNEPAATKYGLMAAALWPHPRHLRTEIGLARLAAAHRKDRGTQA
ncbi:MAG TPA: glycosyltransferase [Actinomycetota bacterium]|nr:glycosyltransferase [Actinomycetota bacterium]